MDKTQEIILTAVASIVGTLIVTGIVGLVAGRWKKRDDRVSVKAALTLSGNHELIERTGCPGLMLTVTCKSQRAAKIKSAKLYLRGFNPMKQIQKGFGSDLGYTPVPAMASDDAFYINLLPMSGPRTPQGFVLERDDACTFYLPFANVLQTAFAEYLKAPSENCQINVTYFDDSADNVIQGLMVQSALEAAMASFGGHNYEPQVTIEMGVQVTSATPPDLSLAGTTNPNPI